MEQFYEDIVNLLNPKKEIEYKKNIKNRDFQPIISEIKELIEIIKKNPEKKEEQQEIINTIMKHIKEININHKLHIDKLIKNNKIDQEQLQFALDILNEKEETQEIIKKALQYAKQGNDIPSFDKIKLIEKEIEDLKNNAIDSIQEYHKSSQKKSGIIKRIIKKILKKEEKTDLLKNIEKIILKANIYNIDSSKISTLKKQMENGEKINLDKAISKIAKISSDILLKFKSNVDMQKEEQATFRRTIKIDQNKLNDITLLRNNSYLYAMTHKPFIDEDDKKSTLLGKVLITLHFIEIISEDQKIRKINLGNIINCQKNQSNKQQSEKAK